MLVKHEKNQGLTHTELLGETICNSKYAYCFYRQTAVLEISNFCLHCLQYSVSLVYLEWKCDYLIKSVMPVNQEQLCYKNKSFFCRRVDGRRKQGTLLLWAISLGDPSMSESYFLIFFGNVATILLKQVHNRFKYCFKLVLNVI